MSTSSIPEDEDQQEELDEEEAEQETWLEKCRLAYHEFSDQINALME